MKVGENDNDLELREKAEVEKEERKPEVSEVVCVSIQIMTPKINEMNIRYIVQKKDCICQDGLVSLSLKHKQ